MKHTLIYIFISVYYLFIGFVISTDDGNLMREEIFSCNFDDVVFNEYCGGSIIENYRYIGVVTTRNGINDITSITKPTESGDYCKLDKSDNRTIENVCKQVIAINFQYQCETESTGNQKCSDGRFLVAESRFEAFESIFTLRNSIQIPNYGLYEFEFYTIFNTPNNNLNDSLSIEIKYDKKNSYELIYFNSSLNNRIKEQKWVKESFKFEPVQTAFKLRFKFSRSSPGPLGTIAFDNITLYLVENKEITDVISTEISEQTTNTLMRSTQSVIDFSTSIFECNFNDDNKCGNTKIENSFNLGLKTSNFLFSKGITVTDMSSITEPTYEDKKCTVPFFDDTFKLQHFCISLSGIQLDFYCKIDQIYKKCRLGKYLAAQTKSDGKPFKSTYRFMNPIKLKETGTYELKFYTFFNCENNCESAGDSISIKISDSINGNYKRIAEISRTNDNQWKNESVTFNTFKLDLNIELEFQRKNQYESIGFMALDNLALFKTENEIIDTTLEVINDESTTTSIENLIDISKSTSSTTNSINPLKSIFKCSFDGSNLTKVCEGSVISNRLNLDLLERATLVFDFDITDVTSVSQTETNLKCEFPFEYQSKPKYFCVYVSAIGYALQCKKGTEMIDCLKGKFLISRPINTGDRYQSIYSLLKPIRLPKLCSYKFKFYTFYYCLNDNCVNAKDTLILRLVNETGDYIEVYKKVFENNKDLKWNDVEVSIMSDESMTTSLFTIELVFLRETKVSGISYIAFDDLTIYEDVDCEGITLFESTTFTTKIPIETTTKSLSTSIIDTSYTTNDYLTTITTIISETTSTLSNFVDKTTTIHLETSSTHDIKSSISALLTSTLTEKTSESSSTAISSSTSSTHDIKSTSFVDTSSTSDLITSTLTEQTSASRSTAIDTSKIHKDTSSTQDIKSTSFIDTSSSSTSDLITSTLTEKTSVSRSTTLGSSTIHKDSSSTHDIKSTNSFIDTSSTEIIQELYSSSTTSSSLIKTTKIESTSTLNNSVNINTTFSIDHVDTTTKLSTIQVSETSIDKESTTIIIHKTTNIHESETTHNIAENSNTSAMNLSTITTTNITSTTSNLLQNISENSTLSTISTNLSTKKGSQLALIIGSSVGGFLILVVIIFGIMFLIFYHKSTKKIKPEPESETEEKTEMSYMTIVSV